MSYLQFRKEELVNLEYSLHREILCTNRSGSYLSTSIVCCNTRKYHGLLVAPLPQFGNQRFVLLSALDETIVQHDKAFNFGIHRYPNGVYEPRGHKYIVDFRYAPAPTIEYRVGGVHLRKELLMVHDADQVLVRYTLLDAHSKTTLRLKPYLAFRNAHALSRANVNANVHFGKVKSGISTQMYPNMPTLNLQLNKRNEFVAVPDWYYNVEYIEEILRGYDYCEDLLTPGFFEVSIKKGESIVFSASLNEEMPTGLAQKFDDSIAMRREKSSFRACLQNAANQFIVRQGNDNVQIEAGYHWYTPQMRETFIALPGITLCTADSTDDRTANIKLCKDVLDASLKFVRNGLFANAQQEYDSVDASLLFFWTLQQYEEFSGLRREVWSTYGKTMKQILEALRSRRFDFAQMHDNGLLWVEAPNKALTWMNACVNGTPVTPRAGYQVEVNALWYNAICYALELAREFKDNLFVSAWKSLPALIEASYTEFLWSKERNHLADYANASGQNVFMRPNQIFATSLKYSPISENLRQSVLDAVTKELLTNKGLRSLAPKNPLYEGRSEGDATARSRSVHQGSVFPWLLGHYIEGNLKLYGKAFASKAWWIIEQFEEDMTDRCIGSIPEEYNGDPPHKQRGCISYVCSVGELLRAIYLLEKYESKHE
jgi:predicted glycogen debranching enzyme